MWNKITALLLVLVLLAAAPAAYAQEADAPDVETLQELLEMAEGLRQSDYTAESWRELRKAVALANAAVGSGWQVEIDSAVGQLGSALSKMVEMDHSQMDAVLAEVEQFLQEDGDHWQRLQNALVAARAAYESGDQALVDSAAAELAANLQTCREQSAGGKGSGSVIWIVLLGISLLGNGVLVAQLVWKKKDNRKKQVDDVPLVDYDIDDDVI